MFYMIKTVVKFGTKTHKRI